MNPTRRKLRNIVTFLHRESAVAIPTQITSGMGTQNARDFPVGNTASENSSEVLKVKTDYDTERDVESVSEGGSNSDAQDRERTESGIHASIEDSEIDVCKDHVSGNLLETSPLQRQSEPQLQRILSQMSSSINIMSDPAGSSRLLRLQQRKASEIELEQIRVAIDDSVAFEETSYPEFLREMRGASSPEGGGGRGRSPRTSTPSRRNSAGPGLWGARSSDHTRLFEEPVGQIPQAPMDADSYEWPVGPPLPPLPPLPPPPPRPRTRPAPHRPRLPKTPNSNCSGPKRRRGAPKALPSVQVRPSPSTPRAARPLASPRTLPWLPRRSPEENRGPYTPPADSHRPILYRHKFQIRRELQSESDRSSPPVPVENTDDRYPTFIRPYDDYNTNVIRRQSIKVFKKSKDNPKKIHAESQVESSLVIHQLTEKELPRGETPIEANIQSLERNVEANSDISNHHLDINVETKETPKSESNHKEVEQEVLEDSSFSKSDAVNVEENTTPTSLRYFHIKKFQFEEDNDIPIVDYYIWGPLSKVNLLESELMEFEENG